MDHNRPLILISNDDGYDYNGIKSLIKVARRFGDVAVVAPAEHQSGKSSAITIGTPLRYKQLAKEEGFTAGVVNGTPADCVKLALSRLMADRLPDLVISGINHGYNCGVNTIYSGTMACAFESILHGVPAVAFSYGDYTTDADTSVCEPVVEAVLPRVLKSGLPKGVCLNINLPPTTDKEGFKGMKVTTSDLGGWQQEFDHQVDPYGRDCYWMTGEYHMADEYDQRADLYWLTRGYVAITPCHIDQTDFESMSQIADLLL